MNMLARVRSSGAAVPRATLQRRAGHAVGRASTAAVAMRRHGPHHSLSRGLVTTRASPQGNSSSSAHALLKRDFRRWLRKEVTLLSIMAIAGGFGVYVYQNRENAPSRKVLQLLDQAAKNAKEGDRPAALKNCLQAYSVTQATNAQDRHLFELAFSIAAQYETLGKPDLAARYYHEAITKLPFIVDGSTRVRSHVVVLDRIAQCYEDQGEHRAAENYYRQAIDVYDKAQPARVLSRESSQENNHQIHREILGVLFNYGQQLFHLKRWADARAVLQRAKALAISSDLPIEYTAHIDNLLAALVEDDAKQDTEFHSEIE